MSTFPANAASAVPLGAVLSVTFSEAMDAQTIDGPTFTLSDGAALIPGGITLDQAAHTASFTPEAELPAGVVYTATITTDARSASGQALHADYSWRFDTLQQEVVASQAAALAVPVPDYTLNVAGLQLLTDALDIVQSAAGTAILTAGLVTGQTYVVSVGQSLDTYAEVDAAYGTATQPLVESGPPTTPTTAALPASAFALVLADLTTAQLRTLIIANTESGVRSYQLFAVTFNPSVRSLD